MIHAVIDTSVLLQDRFRRKASFEALESLARSGHLKIHIPYFVYHEYLANLKEDYSRPLKESLKQLYLLLKKPLSKTLSEKINSQHKILEDALTKIEMEVQEGVKEWIREFSVELYSIETNHGINVGRNYFEGNPPFRNGRERKHFPDAFIFETICQIKKTVDKLFVIVL